ncbi:MAG TPA: recombinase family protein [Xanthobacteraceae bacterium]|jgi:DNA invertase Pin-like site-specific DNA recombinase
MGQAKFVSYLRVSTARQGQSGLGLDAQRNAVASFLNGGNTKLLGEYVEVESGSHHDRPKLAEALSACRLHNATLVIAKLDRLSRDAHFLLGLTKAGVRFIAADMPEANEMVVGMMAVVAQAERKMISQRTKAALAAAKARGVMLGKPENLRNQLIGCANGRAARTRAAMNRAGDLLPIITDIRAGGAASLRAIATELNSRGIPTARGGEWSATQVRRVAAVKARQPVQLIESVW